MENAGGERVLVGIATFDTTIHFYGLRPGQATPQMLVVPDADDPYCPAPAALLVPLHVARPTVRGWSLLTFSPAHTIIPAAWHAQAKYSSSSFWHHIVWISNQTIYWCYL